MIYRMMRNHWMDCALFNGPAERPGWCDCGGYDRTPGLIERLILFVRYRYLWARGLL